MNLINIQTITVSVQLRYINLITRHLRAVKTELRKLWAEISRF